MKEHFVPVKMHRQNKSCEIRFRSEEPKEFHMVFKELQDYNNTHEHNSWKETKKYTE